MFSPGATFTVVATVKAPGDWLKVSISSWLNNYFNRHYDCTSLSINNLKHILYYRQGISLQGVNETPDGRLYGAVSSVKYSNSNLKRGPDYRMDDDQTPPSRTSAGDVLTVERCVAIDLAQLTTYFYRRYALCIQNLYHSPHFTVGGCWNKSLYLQPLQRCYSENSGSPAKAFIMWRDYSMTYMQSLREINGLTAVRRVGNLLCGCPSF